MSEFVLWRMDDNGNRGEMATFADRESAEKARLEYESRGHKQMYWVTLREPRDSDLMTEEVDRHERKK